MATIAIKQGGGTVFNLPTWVDPQTEIDPKTGAPWVAVPGALSQLAGVDWNGPSRTSPQLVYAGPATPQPNTNDPSAFNPQANSTKFRNPA
jgi:hypothetical protein